MSPSSFRTARRCAGLAALGLALSTASSVRAADWTPVAGDLGLSDDRVLVFAGGTWGPLGGSEVEKADPGVGWEVGAGTRVLGSVFVVGSLAANSSDVDGQVVQLIDLKMRADGRSGHVVGTIESTRLMLGVRLDGLGNEGWRFHPYFEAGGLRSTIDVTVDTVDGRDPVPFAQSRDATSLTDISKFDDTQWGAHVRFGVETALVSDVRVDLGGGIDVVEFPPGTHTLSMFGARLVWRH